MAEGGRFAYLSAYSSELRPTWTSDGGVLGIPTTDGGCLETTAYGAYCGGFFFDADFHPHFAELVTYCSWSAISKRLPLDVVN